MSYFAIATRRFDAMLAFYCDRLNLPILDRFERPGARGAFLDLGGQTRMELIDAEVQKRPLAIHETADERLAIVIETADIHQLAASLNLPEPQPVSWGATVVRLKDPDGLGVWIVEWDRKKRPHSHAND